jgi:hypothetical protein
MSAFGQLLEAFRRPSTWPEARLVIHQHPVLLDQEFDSLLASWIAAARKGGDAAAVTDFEGQRNLLRRCRELGVEAAFIAIARESVFGFSPQNEHFGELFRSFFSPPEGAQPDQFRKQLLERNPELLSEAADAMIEEMAALAREQGEDQISLIYKSYQELLRRCREIGTTAAFAELVSDDSFESSELGLLFQEALDAHEQYRSTDDREALQAAVATWQRILAHPDLARPRHGTAHGS